MRTFRPAPTASAAPTTRGGPDKDRAAGHPPRDDRSTITSRAHHHTLMLEDPDKPGHPWSQNPNGGLDTNQPFR
jgi:hypothetical protein